MRQVLTAAQKAMTDGRVQEAQIAEQLNERVEKEKGANKDFFSDGSALMATQFQDSTVLFADIAGFTTMSSKLATSGVRSPLNTIGAKFPAMVLAPSFARCSMVNLFSSVN